MYYKVITHAKSGRRSVVTGPTFAVYYTPDEWTEPVIKGSKLYIYEDLKDAMTFSEHDIYTEVWECEAEDVLPFKACVFSDLKVFWKAYNEGTPLPGEYVKQLPSARLAGRVKLTKCVKECSA